MVLLGEIRIFKRYEVYLDITKKNTKLGPASSTKKALDPIKTGIFYSESERNKELKVPATGSKKYTNVSMDNKIIGNLIFWLILIK